MITLNICSNFREIYNSHVICCKESGKVSGDGDSQLLLPKSSCMRLWFFIPC